MPVLLVEDNPGDVLLIRETLSEHGLHGEVSVVADGDSACRLIAMWDREPDLPCPGLLILDLNLPRRSGREVLQALRGSVRCAKMPVVILSSSSAESDKEAAEALGADGYIQKPITLEEFIAIGAAIRSLLLNRR